MIIKKTIQPRVLVELNIFIVEFYSGIKRNEEVLYKMIWTNLPSSLSKIRYRVL